MSQTPHIQQIRLEHSPELQELLRRHHKAFILLTVIAQRARRTRRDTILNLEPGQALIGDYKNYGMSEQQYRTAKNQLKRYELATFQSTNRGTVAQLCSTAVYDINSEPSNAPPNANLTCIQRAPNVHLTTKKNENGNENEINTPQKSPQGDNKQNTPKSFKQWTHDDFWQAIQSANHDGLLTEQECQEFFDYWTEPSASNKPQFQLQKTWDTRRRMQTALKMVYGKQRQQTKTESEHFKQHGRNPTTM